MIIIEHMPVRDTITIREAATEAGCCVVGANTIGVISPGRCKLGVMPGFLCSRGLVGIGGDPVPGSLFEDILQRFRYDDETEAVLMIGEIGGGAEERAARYLKERGL